MSSRKSFRQFGTDTNWGVSAGGFELPARDAYEMYKYIWDVVKFREGGVFRAKKPPQTYKEMAEDWAEANPHMAHLKDSFWQPEIIRQLGFTINEQDHIVIE